MWPTGFLTKNLMYLRVSTQAFISFFKDFIYLVLERRKRRDEEREENIDLREKHWLRLVCVLTGE